MRIAFPVLWTVLLLSFSALSHPSTAFGQFGESAVKTRVVAEYAQAQPGGRRVSAVELNHDDGFHTWPSSQTVLPEEVASFAIRTEVGLLGPDWAALDGVQYPRPIRTLSPTRPVARRSVRRSSPVARSCLRGFMSLPMRHWANRPSVSR